MAGITNTLCNIPPLCVLAALLGDLQTTRRASVTNGGQKRKCTAVRVVEIDVPLRRLLDKLRIVRVLKPSDDAGIPGFYDQAATTQSNRAVKAAELVGKAVHHGQ